MSLTSVRFLGVPSVQRPDEDMSIELRYSSGFKPGLDDVLLLIPVGWKSLDEHRSIIRTNGQTRLTVSTGNLSEDETDISFQFVYVQEKVPVGVSSPFLVDIPYDEEPLQDDSLDPDIVLVKMATANVLNGAKGGRENSGVYVQANTTTGCGYLKNPLRTKNVATDCSNDPSVVSITEKRESMLDGHTDEESFCIAEMSPSKSSVTPGGNLLAELTEVINEKDKIVKLFQQERRITLEQENRHKHLQQGYDLLMEENSQLKETLKQKQNEIDQLKKTDDHSSQLTSVRQQAPVKVTSGVHGEEQAMKHHQPCIHPSRSLSPLSANGTEKSRSEPHNERHPYQRRSNRHKHWPRYSGKQHRKSCDLHGDSLVDAFDCPVCSGRFPKADGTTCFQRHVHAHFKGEQVFY